MTSLARRTREAKLAAIRAGTALAPTAAPVPTPADSEYAALREHMGEDLRTLSNIQSVELKIEAKRHMVERYQAWIEGALLHQGAAQQDDIVVRMLIWHLDLHNWVMALQLAAYVLANGLSLHDEARRTPATWVAEEIADAALKDIDAVDHGTLIATEQLVEPHDMPDQVRAKLYKAIGRKLMAEADAFDPDKAGAGGKPALLSAARDALARALSLNEKAGVIKDLESLDRQLAKLTAPAT